MKFYINTFFFLLAILTIGQTQNTFSSTPKNIQAVEDLIKDISCAAYPSSQATSVNTEFVKLFNVGFLETFLFYYSCDLRVNWSLTEAFVHCLAGGLLMASASRLGSMPKLTLKDLTTPREVLKHALLFLGVQIVTRLLCMISLFAGVFHAKREVVEDRFILGYDLITYALLTATPLLKRHNMMHAESSSDHTTH